MTAPDHLWFFWPMLGWGIGIIFHAVNVFGIGKSWEEKDPRTDGKRSWKNKKAIDF